MNESTPRRLIRAARRVFAEKGFVGGSIREITREAGANLGAVTYHFGSKQGLYDAVLEDAFGAVIGALRDAGSGPGVVEEEGRAAPAGVESPVRAPGRVGVDRGVGGRLEPLERVEAILRSLFALLAGNPDLQLLILQQAVHRRELPEPAKRALAAILAAMEEALREGQRSGSIRDGDATLMALSVMAQPVYFGLVRRLAPERLAPGGAARGHVEVADHAVRFTRSALVGSADEEGR